MLMPLGSIGIDDYGTPACMAYGMVGAGSLRCPPCCASLNAELCPTPPEYANATCVVPVTAIGGNMYPSCFTGNCAYWGPAKAIDQKELSTASLAIVESATNPWLQIDMGVQRDDIVGVRIVARRDCCVDQSQNLYVYLSSVTQWQLKNTPCLKQDLSAGALKPTVQGQSVIALCPLNTTARYGKCMHLCITWFTQCCLTAVPYCKFVYGWLRLVAKATDHYVPLADLAILRVRSHCAEDRLRLPQPTGDCSVYRW